SDECLFAIGSDTGGSTRQPASFCSVTGLRPTYGRTSRFGVMSMASSLDTIGPLTRNTEDMAIVLQAIAGKDPLDGTTGDVPVPDYTSLLKESPKGLRVGVPKEYFIDGMDPEVEKSVREAVDVLKNLGAKIVDISLPHTKYAIATYYVLCPCEVSSNMARYDGIRYGHGSTGSPQADESLIAYYEHIRSEGFGPEVKRRIMIGTYALSAGYYDAYYRQAQKMRTLICRDFTEAFTKVDVIVSPVAPTPAFPVGAHNSDPVTMYLEDAFTIGAVMAGIPAMSIPCGFAGAKPSREAPTGAKWDGPLPIGLQLMAPQWQEGLMLQAAYAFEQATEWHTKKPTL
ncbi:Asp-tRNA(Asn)/Glu-tRNA(Gln) amidotransferase subunit GatA, partial [Candidatus Peregrinibacteria bacterium]|nr:Asp-tRNA(Asn)/Glu-tRNA(Gln) amidotransferase subunit GatA [Candidatus Peregrinibacteria bacterium]